MSQVAWTAVVVSLPVLVAGYWWLLLVATTRVGGAAGEYLDEYADWAYAPFVVAIGAAYAVSAEPVLRFEPSFLLAVPLGAGLYAATTLVWRRYTGSVASRGERRLVALLPGLLVPFAEELLFRDGLVPLVDVVGSAGFVTVSAGAFGLHHVFLGLHEVVAKAALGVVLCVAFLWTGTVTVPALLHFGYNLAWIRYVTVDPA